MNSLELHFQEVATGGFYKKAILKSFTILTGKHLCRSYKVAGLKTFSFIKKTPIQVFSCQYYEMFKNTYFEEHLRTAASDFLLCIEIGVE